MEIGNPSALAHDFVEHGRSVTCPIIDVHGHWGPFGGAYLPAASEEAMINVLARTGVRLIVCSAHDAILADPEYGNTSLREAIARHRGLLRGYWGINPHYPQLVARAPEELDRNPGFVGYKFLPEYHAYSLTASGYHPILEHADARALPILVHTWGGSPYDSPQHVERVASKYPRAVMLMGHSGYGDWDASLRIARDYPNVYLELTAVYVAHDFAMLPAGSGTPSTLASCLQVNGVIERMVEIAGSRKVLFGTDMPWYSPHFAAGSILFARIGEEARHDILHRNAERIFGFEAHSTELC